MRIYKIYKNRVDAIDRKHWLFTKFGENVVEYLLKRESGRVSERED